MKFNGNKEREYCMNGGENIIVKEEIADNG